MLKTKNKGYTEHSSLSLPTFPQHSALSLHFTCSPLHRIATITFSAYTLKRLFFTNIPHTGAQKTAEILILVIRPHHEVLIEKFTTCFKASWFYYARISQINTSQIFSDVRALLLATSCTTALGKSHLPNWRYSQTHGRQHLALNMGFVQRTHFKYWTIEPR